jgi:3-deoxy-D-manno-octulosonate 8-phosphate phosphatase (KDO 8-P phosphatase)
MILVARLYAKNAFNTMIPAFAEVALVVVDIDGTLTDAKVAWAGPDIGWTMMFSIRDGESIRRLCQLGLPVVPLSRNQTRCARVRMEALGLPCDWLGVADKLAAFRDLLARYDVPLERIAYLADGREDVPILELVGLPIAVADAHGTVRAVAKYVTRARGGEHAFEEVADVILEARGA